MNSNRLLLVISSLLGFHSLFGFVYRHQLRAVVLLDLLRVLSLALVALILRPTYRPFFLLGTAVSVNVPRWLTSLLIFLEYLFPTLTDRVFFLGLDKI